MRKEVIDWLNSAEDDLETAEVPSKTKRNGRRLQRAVEKRFVGADGKIYFEQKLTEQLGLHGKPLRVDLVTTHGNTPHFHNKRTEHLVILDGTGTVDVAGKKFRVKPGHIVKINPGETHCVSSKNGLRYLVFITPVTGHSDHFDVSKGRQSMTTAKRKGFTKAG